MKKARLLPLVFTSLCIAAFTGCSSSHKSIDFDSARSCPPEMAPAGDRAAALERLMEQIRNPEACRAN